MSFRILHKKESPLEVGKKYWDLRESLVTCELLLIRMLKFNPKVWQRANPDSQPVSNCINKVLHCILLWTVVTQ